MRGRQRLTFVFGCLLFGLLGNALAAGLAFSEERDDEIEVVDMTPDEAPSLSMRHITTGLGSLLKGRDHYYTPHEILVETTPNGAFIDLFYVRSNFQKRFEQAESPVRVVLPPRSESGDRDSLTIRVFAEGYRQKSLSVKANTTDEKVVIDLEPLPNELVALAHQYFGGRTSLVFLTREPLTVRPTKTADGMTVILTETAQSPQVTAALAGMRSPIVAGMESQQLGEDLLMKIALAEEAKSAEIDFRLRSDYDAARDLHASSVDLVPKNGQARAVSRAKSALAQLRPYAVSGCSLEFDRAVREQIEPGALSRALTPNGKFTDPYLRAAMRRLGELTANKKVVFTDGSQFDPRVPIELEAALIQAAGAKGYLALLRAFVAEMEPGSHRDETFRSLIAPELDPAEFSRIMVTANESEQVCRAKG